MAEQVFTTGTLYGQRPRLLVDAVYHDPSHPENAMTEVFATTLAASPTFASAFLSRCCGVTAQISRAEIWTQPGRSGRSGIADMAIVGFDATDAARLIVLVECKYNPSGSLRPYWFTADQAAIQHELLDEQQKPDSLLIGICSEIDYKRLDGSRDRSADYEFDPRARYKLINWEQVDKQARALVSGDGRGRDGVDHLSELERRILQEYITYREWEGNSMGAVSVDDLNALAGYPQAEARLLELLGKAATTLNEERDWKFGDAELSAYIDEDAAVFTITALPPEGGWTYDVDADLGVMVTGDTPDDREDLIGPVVYAGLWWQATVEDEDRVSWRKWESKLGDDLECHWGGGWCHVLAAAELKTVLGDRSTPAQQAQALAEWALDHLDAALRLPEPPVLPGA